MTWTVVIIVAVVVLILLVFVTLRNQKDRKEFTNKLNNDYRKSKDQEKDIPADGEDK